MVFDVGFNFINYFSEFGTSILLLSLTAFISKLSVFYHQLSDVCPRLIGVDYSIPSV